MALNIQLSPTRDYERRNPFHGIFFLISVKGSLYAPSHRQDGTYHRLCYHGALVGIKMGPPINPITYHTMSEHSTAKPSPATKLITLIYLIIYSTHLDLHSV